jgi:hypothetical protein
MRSFHKLFSSKLFFEKLLTTALFAAVLAAPMLFSGCSVHAGYRTYDPYYGDYHTWDNGEVVYYNQWEHDTHRDHRDFRKRSPDEQKEYYTWRHNQGGGNQDHH